MGPELNPLHECVFVIDVLREWNVKHPQSRPCQSPARKLCIMHEANDAKRTGVLRQIETKMLAQGIFATLEKAFDESFIDDCARRRRYGVGRRKVSPTERRHPKVLKII